MKNQQEQDKSKEQKLCGIKLLLRITGARDSRGNYSYQLCE